MKSVKIESGEFCVLVKSDNDQIIKLINRDFNHFRSKRNADFVVDLKQRSPDFYTKENVFKIDLKKNALEILIVEYDREHFLYILRSIFSIICSRNNAILLHSAGVVDGDNAYIFCGPSGAGKSTISGLSSDYNLLSDDYIIVKKINNKFRVFGTTLGGEYLKFRKTLKPNNISAKVEKIFFIRQAEENRIEKKGPSEALQELLDEVFFYRDNSIESQKLIAGNFNIIYTLLSRIECYNLYFQKNEGFWKEIKKLK